MIDDSAQGRIHPAAAAGFGRNAGEYERARPDYPAEAVAFLADRLGIGPGRTVLDVGAGTGKLTRLLVPTGCSMVAVEPVEAMRDQLTRVLPGAEVLDATAERLPLADGSVDAVVCGQAFHWFATPGVVGEFARVLAPGGGLGLVWNARDQSVPWVRRFTEILRPWEAGRPDHYTGEWRRAFEPPVPFSELETTSFRYEQAMTAELLVARAASTSFIGALDDRTRAEVLAEVHRLGVEQGESFVLPYRTDVHLAFRD